MFIVIVLCIVDTVQLIVQISTFRFHMFEKCLTDSNCEYTHPFILNEKIKIFLQLLLVKAKKSYDL